MSDLAIAVLALLSKKSYQPLKPKALARKPDVPIGRYAEFRKVLRALLKDGRIELGKNHLIRPAAPHGVATGTFRRTQLTVRRIQTTVPSLRRSRSSMV